MATLLKARAAIVDRLRVLLPLKTCDAYDGRLDAEEIGRVYRAAPAAAVVLLGVDGLAMEGSKRVADARWAIFLLTDASKPERRSSDAIDLVDALLRGLVVERWDLDDFKRASRVRAENLYSEDVDRKGVALWLITWTQPVGLDPELAAAQLDTFARLRGAIAVGDGPVLTDQVELPQ